VFKGIKLLIQRLPRPPVSMMSTKRNRTAFSTAPKRPLGVAAVHETICKTPVMALGIADHVWTIGELMGAGLENAPRDPRKTHGPCRKFRVIDGGKTD
jgi:hypothetical protein